MQAYYRSTKPRRAYKPSASGRGLPGRRSSAFSSAGRARSGALSALRGYVRTAGFYGRFARGTGTELKFLDTKRNTGAAIPTAGQIDTASLNVIAQGAGESERVGRKCTLKQINIRGVASLASVTNYNATVDRLRFIVYWDKQTNGATAAVTDILETAEIQSFNNLANKNRFRILCDKTMVVGTTGGAASTGAYVFAEAKTPFQFYKKLNIPLEFDGATGALTEQRSNNIGVLAISDDGNTLLEYNVRVRYADN